MSKKNKVEVAEPMKRSYLIQRLNKPMGGDTGKLINAFSFGGGLLNGGLSKKAMDLLRQIFNFDYMGAAEFEFGAVPRALTKIAKDETLVTKEIKVNFEYKNWAKNETLTGSNTVFVVCSENNVEEICKRINRYGSNDRYRREYATKERVCLDEALSGGSESRICGWLELDNGFFFFTDKNMFEKICQLFNVTKAL